MCVDFDETCKTFGEWLPKPTLPFLKVVHYASDLKPLQFTLDLLCVGNS